MKVAAKLKYANMSAQKVRLVADKVRMQPVEQAMNYLTFSNKAAAVIVKKLLQSAIANAENNHNLDIDELVVFRIYVDEAPTLKRFRARAKGRGNRILKRNCHVTIEVAMKADIANLKEVA